MGTATETWPLDETDRQRRAILAAADRLLAGTPRKSSGNLSTVQLAVEAGVKYWIVAQKHTDLRDHFQQLAGEAKKTPAAVRKTHDAHEQLKKDHAKLRRHCAGLEELVETYAHAINELARENQQLKDRLEGSADNVRPLTRSRRRP
jgi:chromosome segregation ATPase